MRTGLAKRILGDVIDAGSIISFGVGSSLPSEHPVPQLWLETQTDLQSTIYLAYGGYFRQAFTILRCWLELSIYGVYFAEHYEQQPTSRYKAWRNRHREAPANMQNVARAPAGQVEHQTLAKLALWRSSSRYIQRYPGTRTVKD